MVLLPWGHLETSGCIFDGHYRASYWHLVGRGQGCCSPPTVHRTVPTSKNCPLQMSIVLMSRTLPHAPRRVQKGSGEGGLRDVRHCRGFQQRSPLQAPCGQEHGKNNYRYMSKPQQNHQLFLESTSSSRESRLDTILENSRLRECL